MIKLYKNLICASSWTGYIVDIAVLLLALSMMIVCARKGFIGCLLGLISTLIALVAAIALAKPIVNATDGLFGIQEKICLSFTQSFSKMKGFSTDISALGVEAALEEYNVTAVFAALILKLVGKQEALPTGTTLAGLLGEKTSALAASLIAGILLFILIKLLVFFMKRVLKSAIKKVKFINGIDSLLGALTGLLQAFLIVCAVLAVLAVIPVDSISIYFEQTLFVGKLLYLQVINTADYGKEFGVEVY